MRHFIKSLGLSWIILGSIWLLQCGNKVESIAYLSLISVGLYMFLEEKEN